MTNSKTKKNNIPFTTDKQTLEDLNLLGKYKVGSMFNLFNRVKTPGGERLLESWFRTPLTDAKAINVRSNKIKYLQSLELTLMLDGEQADLAAQYLSEGTSTGRVAATVHAHWERIREMLYRSDRLQFEQRHIRGVQEVLLAASNLLGQLRNHNITNNKDEIGSDSPIAGLQDRLETIVNVPALKQLKAKYPYTVQQVAECRHLFLGKCRHYIEELLALLSEMDVYISVGDVARSMDLTYATAILAKDGTLLEVEDLRHPALSGAVGNTLALTQHSNLLFLTGANMAGKSTWMKTLGISCYLAHMGFPVAAGRMTFGVLEGMFTSINVPDDLSQGWSHFYAEVMRVKHVAKQVSSGKRLFVLFDELFKGTNVKDAYDATLAVTQRLARYRNCAFVISTHITEVGEALKEEPGIYFGYMPTVMEGAIPGYTYRMTEGVTEDKQGMIIIENEGILDILAEVNR